VLNGKYDNEQGNGMSYGYYWCASFATWCFRLAGVKSDAIAGGGVNCSTWFINCKKQGIDKPRSGYIPQAGDIIFFNDPSENREATHVGLVRYSDGNRVYTVEGNVTTGEEYSSNGEYVALKEHDISSSFIVGYATPKYNQSESYKRVDYTGKFLSCGSYIATDALDIFENSDGSGMIGNLEQFSVFSVKAIEGDYMKVIDRNGVVGYVCEVSTNSCRVKTLLQYDTGVGVYVQRSGDVGMTDCPYAMGQKGLLRVVYLPEDASLQIGDRVVTGDLGDMYPSGLTVGHIIEVMPGTVDKVIARLHEHLNIPVIAGGLVECKEEVTKALNAGAVAVSTAHRELWKLN
jgi:hypothetical protein